MQNNYYFLRQLTRRLQNRLPGYKLVSCFSQSKEELVLEFNNATDSFFLRASMTSAFCCLSFPNSFGRARKNSIDLFPTIILKKVVAIRQYENERSFSIELENNLSLLFKMHGSRANVVLLESEEATEIFRNHLVADWDIHKAELDRAIDWSFECFESSQGRLKETYFTLGKNLWTYLYDQGFETADLTSRWRLFHDLLHRLEHPSYLICEKAGKLLFQLIPTGTVLKTFSDPIIAVNEFYSETIVTGALSGEKQEALRLLTARLENGKQYVRKNQEKLDELQTNSHYQAWADLIMANMSVIVPGMERITVEDLYHEGLPIEIKLKKNLSPQKNAEVYYRKGKNQQIEIQKLKESIAAKVSDNKLTQGEIDSIGEETELKGLRKKVEESIRIKPRQEREQAALPYREFEHNGFLIWVGKNASSNDQLTQKYSFKEDLWLHAKDVAGSHVLIKFQSGKKFPKDVIERAAQLAAHFSKRKNETLCPVAVTQKKFVRKRKGDPAGTVVVEREEVILVTPKG